MQTRPWAWVNTGTGEETLGHCRWRNALGPSQLPLALARQSRLMEELCFPQNNNNEKLANLFRTLETHLFAGTMVSEWTPGPEKPRRQRKWTLPDNDGVSSSGGRERPEGEGKSFCRSGGHGTALSALGLTGEVLRGRKGRPFQGRATGRSRGDTRY